MRRLGMQHLVDFLAAREMKRALGIILGKYARICARFMASPGVRPRRRPSTVRRGLR